MNEEFFAVIGMVCMLFFCIGITAHSVFSLIILIREKKHNTLRNNIYNTYSDINNYYESGSFMSSSMCKNILLSLRNGKTPDIESLKKAFIDYPNAEPDLDVKAPELGHHP